MVQVDDVTEFVFYGVVNGSDFLRNLFILYTTFDKCFGSFRSNPVQNDGPEKKFIYQEIAK